MAHEIPSRANPVGVDDLEQEIATVSERVTAIEEAAPASDTAVTEAIAKVDALEVNVSTLSTSVSDVVSAQTSITTKNTEQDDLLTEHATKIAVLESGVGGDAVSNNVALTAIVPSYQDALTGASKRLAASTGSGLIASSISAEDLITELPFLPNRILLKEHTVLAYGLEVHCPPTSIELQDAPDGLDKKDGTGRFANYSEAILDGGDGLSSSLLTLKDFIAEEVWWEDVSNLDVVFNDGNAVDDGVIADGLSAGDYESLAALGIPDTYSEMYPGDTHVTNVRGVRWSTLSHLKRVEFIQNPKNRIYMDKASGTVLQLRRRPVVNRLLGNNISFNSDGIYATEGPALSYEARGQTTDGSELSVFSTTLTYSKGTMLDDPGSDTDSIFTTSVPDFDLAYDARPFLIPLTTVQRRNKGIYVDGLNPRGTAATPTLDAGMHTVRPWNTAGDNGVSNGSTDGLIIPDSVAQCFTNLTWTLHMGGNINGQGHLSGKAATPTGELHDLILTTDVKVIAPCTEPVIDYCKFLKDTEAVIVGNKLERHVCVPISVPTTIPDFYYSNNVEEQYLEFRVDSSGGSYVDFTSELEVGDFVAVYQPDTGYAGYGSVVAGAGRIALHKHYSMLGKSDGGSYTGTIDYTQPCMIVKVIIDGHESSAPLWGDLMCSRAAWGNVFPYGISGLVNPDYLGKLQPQFSNLTRKSLSTTAIGSLVNSAAPLEQSDITLYAAGTIGEQSNKTTGSYTADATRVFMVHYPVSSLTAEFCDHARAMAYHDELFTGCHESDYGNALVEALTGSYTAEGRAGHFRFNSKHVQLDKDGKFSGDFGIHPEHDHLPHLTGDPVAAKMKAYLSEGDDGFIYINYLFKGMRRNLSAFDGSLPIVIPLNTPINLEKGKTYKLPNDLSNDVFSSMVIMAIDDVTDYTVPVNYADTWGISADTNNIIDFVTGDVSTVIRQFDGDAWGDDGLLTIENGFNIDRDLTDREIAFGCGRIKTDRRVKEA